MYTKNLKKKNLGGPPPPPPTTCPTIAVSLLLVNLFEKMSSKMTFQSCLSLSDFIEVGVFCIDYNLFIETLLAC